MTSRCFRRESKEVQMQPALFDRRQSVSISYRMATGSVPPLDD